MKSSDARTTVQSWPKEAKKAAQMMIQKYGQPDEVTTMRVVWHDNGPWKRTVVTKEETDHAFPMAHKDVLEQVVDYRVQPATVVRLLLNDLSEQAMATMTRQRTGRETQPPPAKVEDNTLDQQHAGIPERTFPTTDNDQSTQSGQSHVTTESQDDRHHRISVGAYLRAQRRGFVPGAELEDWLAAERDEDSRN